jgi:hypothetical protein
MNKLKMNPLQFKNFAMPVIINAWDKYIKTKETNNPTTLPEPNKSPARVP